MSSFERWYLRVGALVCSCMFLAPIWTIALSLWRPAWFSEIDSQLLLWGIGGISAFGLIGQLSVALVAIHKQEDSARFALYKQLLRAFFFLGPVGLIRMCFELTRSQKDCVPTSSSRQPALSVTHFLRRAMFWILTSLSVLIVPIASAWMILGEDMPYEITHLLRGLLVVSLASIVSVDLWAALTLEREQRLNDADRTCSHIRMVLCPIAPFVYLYKKTAEDASKTSR